MGLDEMGWHPCRVKAMNQMSWISELIVQRKFNRTHQGRSSLVPRGERRKGLASQVQILGFGWGPGTSYSGGLYVKALPVSYKGKTTNLSTGTSTATKKRSVACAFWVGLLTNWTGDLVFVEARLIVLHVLAKYFLCTECCVQMWDSYGSTNEQGHT